MLQMLTVWQCVTVCDDLWQSVTICDNPWQSVTICDNLWQSVESCVYTCMLTWGCNIPSHSAHACMHVYGIKFSRAVDGAGPTCSRPVPGSHWHISVPVPRRPENTGQPCVPDLTRPDPSRLQQFLNQCCPLVTRENPGWKNSHKYMKICINMHVKKNNLYTKLH